MAYQLERLKRPDGSPLTTTHDLSQSIERLIRFDAPRFRRLWAYYRNPMKICALQESGAERPYRQGQEWGLPSRITGLKPGAEIFDAREIDGVARKEVVIENDIGWRLETMVDALFGKPLVIRSTAPDPNRRALIDNLIRAILAHNGGLLFLQQLALLGAVHGFVDVLVKLDRDITQSETTDLSAALGQRLDDTACGTRDLGQPPAPSTTSSTTAEGGAPSGPGTGAESPGAPSTGTGTGPAEPPTPPKKPADASTASPAPASTDPNDTGARNTSHDAILQRVARMVRLEIVEPARALPLLSPADYRIVDAYAQAYTVQKSETDSRPSSSRRGRFSRRSSWLHRLFKPESQPPLADDDQTLIVEIISPDRWHRYEDETLTAEGANSLGQIPLVHIQNTSIPFEYSGASDVEGLIPLQDELNTRLSDRASRITLQSFKMYLGKGIDGFEDLPVSPGRMWTTDNDHANVIEFGGDADSPSETAHIADLREAMDKSSGVSPIAAGAIKNRIGRLTSAAALRLTMNALLAKTEKKRTTYGLGLARMIELSLAWLDRAGIFKSDPSERGVELHWPSPLPENAEEKLREAEVKARLGVPTQIVLRELGY